MFKIGLTGGICTGKTFILGLFKDLDCYTLRADDVARDIIFSSNSEVVPEIIEVFGPDVYDQATGINKEAFTRAMFEDEEKRIFINNLVHPLVKEERRNIIRNVEKTEVYDFFVYESALLVEAGSYKEFDKIIIAYTTPEEQAQRLMDRDSIEREDAEKRIKSQFPLTEKLKVAHYAIDTTGSFEQTKTKILETFHLMKKDLKVP